MNRRTRKITLGVGAAALAWTLLGASHLYAQQVAPQPTPDEALAAQTSSSRWPLMLTVPQGQVTIYQPQLRNFDGNQIKARAALSVLAPGQQEPIFGALWMESRVSTDRVARTVRIIDVNVTRVKFPDTAPVSAQDLTQALAGYNASQGAVTLSLDQVLSMLEVVQKEKTAVKDLATTPPKILFIDHPAVLVQYEGQPRLMQVENSPLIRAANTPFFVTLDPPTKTYFLKGASQWYAAPNPLGPFAPTNQVPSAVAALAVSSGYQDPQAPIEGVEAQAIQIVTATDPTELIWTDGPEEMGTIPGTDLLYVSNTPSDVFLLIDTQQIFVLLSGRWYVAPNHNGPWTYVPSDKLPADFARIPPGSDKADVLAQVAGTPAAKDAVADAYVPQTASIDRANFEQPPVQYDGEPQFQSITDSPVTYAVNTPNAVLLVNGIYYCCYNAVWYQSPGPNGPWGLCLAVPPAIYTIPPTCPDYAVRYCYVYQVTPSLVYCGYTPGYVGCYPYNHVVVYGTGYYYKPWFGRRYYPRPWTYGFSARYDPYSGHWGFDVGFARGGGYAWFGTGQRRAGAPSAFFGRGGYRPAVMRNDASLRAFTNSAYRGQVRDQSLNLYERRKDVRATAAPRIANRRPGQAEVGRQNPGRGQTRTPQRNDVFAGKDGSVYRKTIDGWEQRTNGKWAAPSAGQSPPREKGQGSRQPTPRDQPVREQPNRAQPTRDQPVREQPTREQPTREQPAREKPTADQPVREQPTREQPKREQPAREEPARQRPSAPPELNQDYRARVAGQQRSRSYSPPPQQQAPRQAGGRNETPSQSPSRGGGGGGGAGAGSRGNSGGGGSGQNQRH